MLKEHTKKFLKNKEMVINQIKSFERGYAVRDMESLPLFVDSMFVSQGGLLIIGTSSCELYFGHQEAEEIIKNDWMLWGKMSLDYDSIDMVSDGGTAYFAIMGDVTYSFSDSEERYERYVNSLLSYFSQTSKYRNMTYRARLAQMNWLLSMLLSSRADGVRDYKWPLKLSGIAVQEGEDWRFKCLQFSFKRAGRYADVRFDTPLAVENANSEDKERAHVFMMHYPEFVNHQVRDYINRLQEDYLGNNQAMGLLIDGVFSEDICINSTYGYTYSSREEVEAFVKAYEKQWDFIYVDTEQLLSISFDQGACFLISGYIMKHMTQNQAIIDEAANVKAILKGSLPPKDKLFRIRKDISRTVMETFKGENYVCPIRIEGIIREQGDKKEICRLNFSLPSYWVIEGLYD